ncbi:MAG: PAS domain-containing protein, partial [Betaproteobacteria bacterium]|nr:PAS domain-containing protein [Betaproteobacteria bacterium]
QIESCHLRRDGTCLDTAGTLVAIRDANGESVFSTLTLWDITQQKQLERAMQQKAALNELLTERLQRALDGSNLALFDVDLNTGEVYLSEAWAAMLGEEPKPIIDTYENLITRVHPEETERVNKQFYDALKGRIPAYDVVHRVMSRTGEWKWIHSRAKVVERDENGRALRLTGVNADITERVRSEQEIARLNQSLEQRVAERTRQLEATNKELEAFSYSVSHDLRAPLRGIDGFSQLLLQKYAGQLDATGSDYLQRIRRAGLRMAELIDDLLQLSRVSRSQIRTEPLDLSRLARSILATLREREPERRVVTDVQDGVELNADPHLLKIVLENLLGNAWKFTGKREEATIRVEAREQDGEMVVFVKDNGAGFDIKYAHKLFGAFQRLHGAAEFEGTGIGLATVQRIINLHGGRIWADSTLGTGATFYFVIPRALRHETTTA